jgi:hypothetical protein
LLWLLEPAKPIRVYSQEVRRVMYPKNGAFDQQWIMVTLDNGCVITVGGGWIMPPGYPNFSTTWIGGRADHRRHLANCLCKPSVHN